MGNQGVQQGDQHKSPTNQELHGWRRNTAPPVSIDDVAVNCAGDRRHPRPRWQRRRRAAVEPGLYAASFTTDPHDAAHRLSKDDPRYTKADTEKKLLEKINARAANPDAGWPTCDSFSALHPACATCPLFAQKKSPFHHARRGADAAATSGAMQGFASRQRPADAGGLLAQQGQPRLHHGYQQDGRRPTPSRSSTTRSSTPASTWQEGLLLYRAIIGGIESWRDINVGTSMQPADSASALAKNNGALHRHQPPQSSEGFSRDLGIAPADHQAHRTPEHLRLDQRRHRLRLRRQDLQGDDHRHRLPRQALRPQLLGRRRAEAMAGRHAAGLRQHAAGEPWWRRPSPRRWSSWSAPRRW